jgi:UDP-N-acetylglucosamine:LPS N-acetylglucosamine transferase
MIKVLAISSPGGHWVQLCRVLPALKNSNIVYACTYSKPIELTDDNAYYVIDDISRDTIRKLPVSVYKILSIMRRERPSHVITTGALPGLISILLARLLGAKTIWLDSIANSEKISGSGRVAAFIAHDCLTQWDHLSTSRIKYMGRVV